MNVFGHGDTLHNWSKVDDIIEALQATGYQARLEREGSSNKKHQLLGIGLYYVDSACQYVVPCFNDLEFELNPIILREGKLIVSLQKLGKASSIGKKWFESWVTEGEGRFSMFMSTQSNIDEAVRTIQPVYEPPVELVPKDQAAAAASDAAATAVQQTPAAATDAGAQA